MCLGDLFGGPDVPDPYQTAGAQGTENRNTAVWNTALNRPNIDTPWGSLKWTQDANDPTKWSGNVSLTDQFYDQAKSFGQSGSAQSSSNYSNSSTRPTPIDELMYGAYSGLLPHMASTLKEGPQVFGPNYSYGDATMAASKFLPQMDNLIRTDISPNMDQTKANTLSLGSALGSGIGKATETMANGLSYDSLGARPEASEATRQQIQDALYGQYASRLNPEWTNKENDLNSRLAAQGITQGSEAYNREMDTMGRSKNDAYDQARRSATADSTNEMAKLFGMEMAGRQQGVSELNTLHKQPLEDLALMSGVTAQQNQILQGLLNTESVRGNQDIQKYATDINRASTISNIGSQAVTSDLATNKQLFDQNNAGRDELIKIFSALRSGGQANLSTSNSGGNSSGSSQSYNQSYQIPNFLNLGAGSANTAGAAPIASSINSNYANETAGANANMQGMSSIAAAALMGGW